MNDMTMTQTRKINGIDCDAIGAMVDAIGADPREAEVQFRVTTAWSGGTRSETCVDGYTIGGETIARRFSIVADEPLELCGTNTAPNPQELLMAAANACMTVGYVANAALMGVTLDMLEIEMRGMLDLRGFLGLDAAVPAGYREIDYVVRMRGDGSPEQYRQIHDAVLRTSPNLFNLAQPIRMNATLALD